MALFAVVVTSLGALLWQESHRQEPLIELRFFRSVPFSGATVIAVSAFAALGGYLFLNTLYLQEVRGLSPFHAGLLTLPIAAMTLVFAPLSGRLVGRRGSRVPLVLGGVGITVSSLMLTGLSNTTPVGWLLVAYLIFGIGFGLVNPPITVTAVSGMPAAQAGVASAVASTSRQIGQTLGVALAGAIAAPAAEGALRLGLAHSSHAGWWFIAGCGLLVFVLGLASTTQRARRTARVASAQFVEADGLPAGA
jgi:MFS family permease